MLCPASHLFLSCRKHPRSLCRHGDKRGEGAEDAREGFCMTKSCTESIQKQELKPCTFSGTQGAIPTSSAVWKGSFCAVAHKGRNNQAFFLSSNDTAQLLTLQLWIGSPSTGYRNCCVVFTTTLQSPALIHADCFLHAATVALERCYWI